MPTPDFARSPHVLRQRVRRLLGLGETKHEISGTILPFLGGLGTVSLIGGAVRDVARAGRQGFSSDLDFVVSDSDRSVFVYEVTRQGGIRNRFGGYALRFGRWKVDVWHIDDTWAKTAGLIRVNQVSDLLRCTFFDWDSALFCVTTRRLMLSENYLDRLKSNVMNIELEENPNPEGSVIRALRRASLWGVKLGPSLTLYCRRGIEEMPWDKLVSIDAAAFRTPVLKHLDRKLVLNALSRALHSGVEAKLPLLETGQTSLPFMGRQARARRE
jgi:hypothetical protein